jgi:hypothetical protein
VSDAWWALQEPVVVLTDENRHNGIKAEYLGVYRPVGMHEGAFHYENESGSHLYYNSGIDAWVVLDEFAPTENVAAMYIDAPAPAPAPARSPRRTPSTYSQSKRRKKKKTPNPALSRAAQARAAQAQAAPAPAPAPGHKQANGLVGRKEWKCDAITFARQAEPGAGFRTHHITVKLAPGLQL